MPHFLLLLAALAAAPQGPASELSEERAKAILPRADLHELNDAQRAQFLEIAGDTFDYAGCNDTLAVCLRDGVKDRHALRMTLLIKYMLLDGYTPSVIIEQAERYYASFPAAKRKKIDDLGCPSMGDPKAPVVVVEWSDFQCPFCAAATKPIHDLVNESHGKVRLCSKYFPLNPTHPRGFEAAQAAEFARRHGKFWEMAEMLFGHQDTEELDDAHLKQYANDLKLDGAKMLKEMYAGKLDDEIKKEKQEGIDAGVRATPSLYFNGRQFTLPLKPAYLAFSAQDEEEWHANNGWGKD